MLNQYLKTNLSVQHKGRSGFTLIEILVVISIIGVLSAILLPNLVGMRERARDATAKGTLTQLKSALRLFYNDYQYFPANSAGNAIQGCGTAASPGTTACTTTFATTSTGATTYMQELPASYHYTQTSSGDAYVLYTLLENASDGDIADSAARCGIGSPVTNAFYVCE